MRFLAWGTVLLIAVAACSGPEIVDPAPTPLATPDAESVAPSPVAPPNPDTESVSLATATPATLDVESTVPAPTMPATPDTENVAPTPTVPAIPDAENVAPAPTAPATPDVQGVAPALATPTASDAESMAPTLPAAPDAQGVAPEPTQEHTTLFVSRAPEHHGAGTPSVEARIYDSDVVIRTSLQSARTGSLRFRVIEYLKGTGPVYITVHASTSNHNTAWDDREAVLFLSLPEGQAASGAAGGVAAGEFVFTEGNAFTHPIYEDRSKRPTGYTIDSRDPAWLPAESAGGASGAAGAGAPTSDPAFITDSAAVTGGSPPTIALSALRSKITWVEGGEGIEGYDQCIRMMLDYKRYDRDWEAYYGTPWTPYQSKAQVASGAGEGASIYVSGPHHEPGYHRFWLTGQDVTHFKAQIIDDDEVPSNGYSPTAMTARPLPSGVYRFYSHFQRYEYMPCNFTPENHRLEWVVTAVAPESVLHEAFFDPVAIGGAVGADAANGVLKPASFSLTGGGSTASLVKIDWETNRATMELSSSLSLAGHHADFIALDGTVSLRLDFDDATVTADGTKRTLAWNVCAQPWESGDLLMLRISSSGEDLTGVTNDGPCN